MLCEECGIREANVRFTTITNGNSYEKNLCSQCFAKHKHDLFDGISLGDLMAGFLKEGSHTEESELRCPTCGMTYEQFRTGGRLGCANCYKAFAKQLEPMLERMHGRVVHAGKVPENRRPAPEEHDKMKDSLAALKKEMEQAVAAEDFERAASLRDQIKALQKEGE